MVIAMERKRRVLPLIGLCIIAGLTIGALGSIMWTRQLGECLRARGAKTITDADLFLAFWSKPMPDKQDESTPFMRRLSDFAVELGGTLSTSETGALADELCDTWQTKLPLAADALHVFTELNGRHKTAVVSNFGHPPHVRRYLKAVGIADRTDGILVSGDYPFAKPDPRLLLEACKDLTVDPERGIYVGDSIVDYRASVGARMVPVLIRRDADRKRWPDDGRPSRFAETDKELEEQVSRGELIGVSSLTEILDIIASTR